MITLPAVFMRIVSDRVMFLDAIDGDHLAVVMEVDILRFGESAEYLQHFSFDHKELFDISRYLFAEFVSKCFGIGLLDNTEVVLENMVLIQCPIAFNAVVAENILCDQEL